MKISLIGIRPNHQQICTSTKEVKEAKTQINREFVYASYPVHPSFSGTNTRKLELFSQATKLHCPYCALKLIPVKVYESLDFSMAISAEMVIERLRLSAVKITPEENGFFNRLITANNKFPEKSYVDLLKSMSASKLLPRFEGFRNIELSPREYSKKIIDKLKLYEGNMRPIQKEVFTKIKKMNQENPDKTIEELFSLMRTQALKALRTKQIGILNSISNCTTSLPRDTAQEVTKIVTQARNLINSNRMEHFRRKVFLSEIADLIRKTDKKVDFSGIYQIAATLPTSSNNVDAFIVKYSGKVPVLEGNQKVYKPRSSREIAQNFLYPSLMTLEHIIPQHTLADYPHLTPPRNANYLPTCAPCNNSGKGGMKLSDFIRKFPVVKANILRFISDAVVETNAGKIKDLDYVKDVSKTIVEESDGAIKPQEIDLSKLDLYKASLEIAMQDPRFKRRVPKAVN